MRARSFRRAALAPVVGLIALCAAPAASADDPFFTAEPLMITLSDPATSHASAIISSGDELGDFLFEGIPDGIGAMPGVDGSVEVFVNHEQSTVPFNNLADFEMASISHLTLAPDGGVLDASVALPDSAGFQRFCSATMAGPADGLSSYLYLTGEEAPDALPVPAGAPYGPDPAYAPEDLRQSGYAVVLDPVTGEYTQVAGMGRHNHENVMVLPGAWDKIAIYSGDDTFTPPSSQLYLYLAEDEDAIWADEGNLLAFRVTHKNGVEVRPGDPFNGANDYGDVAAGDHLQGRFIRVPGWIARGTTAREPQEALERWSNRHNVFQFIRVEDTAYDPDVPLGGNPVMYVADTGSSSAVADPATGRLTSGSGGPFGNGRIFQMTFAKHDPRRVVDFSIVLDGNASENPLSPAPAMKNPDNLGISSDSLMIQEDVSSGFESRILRYDLNTAGLTVVAHVNTIGWESSGIVDASAFFGEGAWLLDVQAHTVFVDQETVGDVTLKREAGQLILLHVDGS
ncbi:MAG TPA: alkaline phosphatase PhoX [Actinomycetota bacterium]|nr:alkaline phosphatase PhoX [Actinomycetota bacterium]